MIRVVTGGQFGSEGKGAVCGHLAQKAWDRGRDLVAVRVAGPNAGHTAYDADGRCWKFRHLPVAAVVHPEAHLVLAAGSEIDTEVLDQEVNACEEAGIPVRSRLWVDPQATLIEHSHKHEEEDGYLTERVGSTAKGIGAARAKRVWRQAKLFQDWDPHGVSGYWQVDTAEVLNRRAQQGTEIHIEGTQGFGLGLHAGYYPYCTSSDCRAQDFLAMAGIRPGYEVEPWVVLRTYPIRVAGNSGPLISELTWEEMEARVPHLDRPETTTVTGKVRRIGQWDPDLARRAVAANGVKVRVALTFLDYVSPELHDKGSAEDLSESALGYLAAVEREIHSSIDLVGTGPSTMIELS